MIQIQIVFVSDMNFKQQTTGKCHLRDKRFSESLQGFLKYRQTFKYTAILEQKPYIKPYLMQIPHEFPKVAGSIPSPAGSLTCRWASTSCSSKVATRSRAARRRSLTCGRVKQRERLLFIRDEGVQDLDTLPGLFVGLTARLRWIHRFRIIQPITAGSEIVLETTAWANSWRSIARIAWGVS